MHDGWSIRAVDVITIVEAAFDLYGRPQHMRSDNGPEFIAYAKQDWHQLLRDQDHLQTAWLSYGIIRPHGELP